MRLKAKRPMLARRGRFCGTKDKMNNNANLNKTQGTFYRIPDDGDIANIWIHENPTTIWRNGKFERYINNAWKIISRDDVRQEILHVMELANFKGYKINTRTLASVMELVRLEIYTKSESLIFLHGGVA